MGKTQEIHGPWRVPDGHPDGEQHVGYALSFILGDDGDQEDVTTTDETQAATLRYASCECGWKGQQHDPPKATDGLRTRRYRKQTREVLRPEWDDHVAQWFPEPLPEASPASPSPVPAEAAQSPSEAPAEDTRVDAQDDAQEDVDVAPEAAEEQPEEAPEERPAFDEDPVRRLRDAARTADLANAAAQRASEELTAAVRDARRAGQSWAKVGALTGMSRQAAHERWRVV